MRPGSFLPNYSASASLLLQKKIHFFEGVMNHAVYPVSTRPVTS